MAGHSKWATTKHKKAALDAKRGKLFAKLIKHIEVAAKTGGPDPAGNPTLFDAIQKAKKQSVPNKNIDSAVKRGGGLEGLPGVGRRVQVERREVDGGTSQVGCGLDAGDRYEPEPRVLEHLHLLGHDLADDRVHPAHPRGVTHPPVSR